MNAAGSFLYRVLVGYALTTGIARGVGAGKVADKLDARVLPQLDRAAAAKERLIGVLNELGDDPRQAFERGFGFARELQREQAEQDELAI